MNVSVNQVKLGLMALCFVLSGASVEKAQVQQIASLYKVAQASSTPDMASARGGAITNEQQAESIVRTLVCSEGGGGGGGPIRFA
jgi:hypothetical protein